MFETQKIIKGSLYEDGLQTEAWGADPVPEAKSTHSEVPLLTHCPTAVWREGPETEPAAVAVASPAY